MNGARGAPAQPAKWATGPRLRKHGRVQQLYSYCHRRNPKPVRLLYLCFGLSVLCGCWGLYNLRK